MSRRAVFVLIAAALVAMLATNLTTYHRAEAQEAGNVVLTIRNVTAGQPLTPAVVVVHDGGADLLPENAEDLAGLEELAESGQPAALAASLRDVAGVKDTLTLDPPPLPPGPGGDRNHLRLAGRPRQRHLDAGVHQRCHHHRDADRTRGWLSTGNVVWSRL